MTSIPTAEGAAPMYRTWMRYFTPGPLHHRLGLVCLGVGRQHGTLPAVGPRTLDHHVAVVVSSGRGWLRTPAGETLRVTAPAVLWLAPGVPHHYGADPVRGWEELFVDFTGPAVAAYTELGCVQPEHPVVPLTDTVAARDAVMRIARAAHEPADPLLELEGCAAVHQLLVALRRARADTTAAGSDILQALARNAFLPLSIAEHAARLGMTTAELRNAVRRSTGSNPKDYLLGIRLDRAKELLAGSSLPVSVIARRVGYDDPAYFSRLFTRRVNMAPVRFRALQDDTLPGGWSDRIPDPDDPPTAGHSSSSALGYAAHRVAEGAPGRER